MATNQAIRLKITRQNTTPIQSTAEGFLLDREANRCTAATMVWYRKYVGALLRWLEGQGIDSVERVTATHMRAWLVALRGRGLADRTIHHHASAARTFFNFCVDEGVLDTSPMLRVKMPRLPKEILPALTPDDVQAITGACKSERDRAIVLVLIDTGCRAAELVALNVGDVDVGTGEVLIHEGKGRKDRSVFIGAKARRVLHRYLTTRTNTHPNEPLWLSQNTGSRLTTAGLTMLLKRLARRSGVANCHPHTFRRTFALWSLRAGMDVYSLQRLMGHSDLSILRRYLAQDTTDLATAHAAHGAVDTMLAPKRKV